MSRFLLILGASAILFAGSFGGAYVAVQQVRLKPVNLATLPADAVPPGTLVYSTSGQICLAAPTSRGGGNSWQTLASAGTALPSRCQGGAIAW